MNELLKLRNEKKRKQPDFHRQDSNKYVFKNKWRKPRGLHNKKRLNKKGNQPNPSTGYGSPVEVKYLNRNGYITVLVKTLNDLNKIDKEKEIVVLSSTLGARKRIIILKKALELGLKIENVKDINKYIESKTSAIQERKKLKLKKKEEKEKSKKESLKKKEKKEVPEDKQKEVKEEIMGAKQEITAQKDVIAKEDYKSKAGHMLSSVPGTKQ